MTSRLSICLLTTAVTLAAGGYLLPAVPAVAADMAVDRSAKPAQRHHVRHVRHVRHRHARVARDHLVPYPDVLTPAYVPRSAILRCRLCRPWPPGYATAF